MTTAPIADKDSPWSADGLERVVAAIKGHDVFVTRNGQGEIVGVRVDCWFRQGSNTYGYEVLNQLTKQLTPATFHIQPHGAGSISVHVEPLGNSTWSWTLKLYGIEDEGLVDRFGGFVMGIAERVAAAFDHWKAHEELDKARQAANRRFGRAE